MALGTSITAGFFRNDKVKEMILRSSKSKGENIWEMPLTHEYEDYLKSDIADLCNIGEPDREAGSIIAALFLANFTQNSNWIHL